MYKPCTVVEHLIVQIQFCAFFPHHSTSPQTLTQQVKTNQNLSNVTDFVFVSSASPLFHKDFAWLPLYPPVTCVSMWTSPPMSNTVIQYETT